MRAQVNQFGSVRPAVRIEPSPRSLPEAFLVALIVACVLRAFSFGTTGLDWDESFYVVVAQRWLHGDVPYADIWDIHPMGVPALFALGTRIVGDGLLAARLLALLAVAGTAALLWVFLDRYTRIRPAGILAALFYLAYMSRPEGLAANTEVFNNFAVTAASFILAGEVVASPYGMRPGPVFSASLLLGAGLQLKYVVFPEAVALCGAALLWELISSRSATGSGGRSWFSSGGVRGQMAASVAGPDEVVSRHYAVGARRDGVGPFHDVASAPRGGTGSADEVVAVPPGAAGMWLAKRVSAGSVRRVAGLAGIAIAGGLLPTILATLYFWGAGALQPYLDATLRANVAYVAEPISLSMVLARLRYGLLPICGLLIWPIVLAVLARHRVARPRIRVICLWLSVWLFAACVDVVLPLKFWKHYFNALIPPLCLMSGLAAALLARLQPARMTRVLAGCVPLTLVPAMWEMATHVGDSRTIGRVNVPSEIGALITAGGSNGHDVYVFDYDPLVYAYSGAKPPSRFVLGVELADFGASAGTSARSEIGRVLDTKPRWIVTTQPSPYTFDSSVLRELERALRDYEIEATFHETDYVQPVVQVSLWRRRGPRLGDPNLKISPAEPSGP